ncbi:glycoside hydrolase (GH113) [Formosa agariphila KMM 3901]|uniref:Glycoside hydrolase (GH113) n=1 Tax=Formosa agariphila (strain DSM 15362 / KCTC 12365 / LMG 23005 / KMM 3901 / M-2Alg 35-1) TaxID=1347342 RepID=T2KJB4_FORAG|nr:glycoside hydrolase TIM-barrel-like domain-containing protein [Formosa agariphila]CDF78977.1 glycoside hydrolase (GH113) [Formosa agariphila KMM 3901]
MKSKHTLVLLLLITILSCQSQSQKINGVSFVASRDTIHDSHIKPIVNLNANYAAIMPFGFIRNINHPEIKYNSDRQWYGETKSGAKHYIQALQKQNIHIMLKPQIWISHGAFTGNILMETENNWRILEDSYTKFILEYAKLAEDAHVDLFCIGTELEQFIKHRPEYWQNLILKIKDVYSGKLTYAANWDEFKYTPFWSNLDYIGIDAYFPLSKNQTPTFEDALAGWSSHKKFIHDYYNTYNKPILFTEYGYRSVDYAGKEPWKSDRNMTQVNLEAQLNCSQALFESFWHEEWFAGGFVWKWFINHDTSGGEQDSRFTPQNKPVENLIKTYYGKYAE